MAEDRIDEVDVEEKTDDVNEDVIDTPEDTLPDLVGKIRVEYEAKLAEMEAQHKAAIEDRDAIIQQLISGNSSSNKPHHDEVVDKINAKRNFKKW